MGHQPDMGNAMKEQFVFFEIRQQKTGGREGADERERGGGLLALGRGYGHGWRGLQARKRVASRCENYFSENYFS